MLVGLLVGVLGFQFIFERTNVSRFKVIQTLQKKLRGIKYKQIIEYGCMLVIGGVIWSILAKTHLGSIPQGFIVGIIWAAIMMIFEDTMFDNARNSLR